MANLFDDIGSSEATVNLFDDVAAQSPTRAWAETIERHAKVNSLSVPLLENIVKYESSFNAQAVSPKGAMGATQLMPGTARQYGVKNPFDIDQNIGGGAKHLRTLLDKYDNNVTHAVAAYNAGEVPVDQWLAGKRKDLPGETKDFVGKVTGIPWGDVRKAPSKVDMAMEDIGEMAGGFILPLGAGSVWTAVPLAALGGMAGKAIQKGINVYRGKEEPSPPDQAMSELGGAAIRQGLAEIGGRGIAGVARAFGPATGLRSTFTPEAEQAFRPYVQKAMGELGKSENVTGYSIGQKVKNTAWQVIEELTEKNIMGGPFLRSYRTAQQEGLKDMTEDLVSSFWNRSAQQLSPFEMGEATLKVYDTALDAFRTQGTGLYGLVDQATQGATVSLIPLKQRAQDIMNTAEKMVSIGSSDAGDNLLNKLLKLPDDMSFMDAHALRSRLYDEVSNFVDKRKGRALATEFSKLVDSSMEQTARSTGLDAYTAWKMADDFYKQGSEAYYNKFIAKMVERIKVNPEKVVESIFNPGQLSDIKKVRKMLLHQNVQGGSEAWDALQASFTERLLTQNESATTDLILGNTLKKKMKNLGNEFLSEIYTPTQLRSIQNVVDAARTVATTPGDIASRSSIINISAGGLLVGGIGTSIATGDVKPGAGAAGAVLIGPRVLARMMTNPMTSRLLIDGLIRVPPGTQAAANLSTRLVTEAMKIHFDQQKPEYQEKQINITGE